MAEAEQEVAAALAHKYEDDLELKVLMDQVKARIQDLEKDGEMDEKALQNLLDRELEKAIAADKAAMDDGGSDVVEVDDYDADIKEIVNTVREEEGMKEVS